MAAGAPRLERSFDARLLCYVQVRGRDPGGERWRTWYLYMEHGATGRVGTRFISLLQEGDHHVIAVQNPLTSLADDVANVRAILAQLGGPTVLAGHSYGGPVISGGPTDTATGLVFVAAIANDEDESVDGVLGRFPESDVPPVMRVDERSLMTIERDAFPRMIAGDVGPSRGAVMSAVQKPTACFSDALSGPPAWRSLPSTFLISEQDRAVHPEAQSFMAGRMGRKSISLPSSHASIVSHPREVPDAILCAAGSFTLHQLGWAPLLHLAQDTGARWHL